MRVYYYPPLYSYGAKVIVDNFKAACERAGLEYCLLENLNNSKIEDFIIPQGVKNGVELLRRGYHTSYILLGDAMSLGYYNKMIFYLKKGHVFNKDFLYSVYGYLKYRREDKRIVNHYSGVVLYSQSDIDFLIKLAPRARCRYICVPNGIYKTDNVQSKSNHEKFTLGLMSSWGSFQSYEENNWFIRTYYKRYIKTQPNVKLLVAGRGEYISKLLGLNNVTVIGEVADLGDFFNQIDLFLSVNPKGCGILNRVLDAIVYKVPVMGNNASFSGFQNSEGIFLRFSDYNSFVKAMDYALNHKNEIRKMADNAYEYALENNDWNKNYDYLVNNIVESAGGGLNNG